MSLCGCRVNVIAPDLIALSKVARAATCYGDDAIASAFPARSTAPSSCGEAIVAQCRLCAHRAPEQGLLPVSSRHFNPSLSHA
jgi:hypothetical protein